MAVAPFLGAPLDTHRPLWHTLGVSKAIRVTLDESGLADLALCVAAIPPFRADGSPRSLTLSEAVREALRRWAGQVRGGGVEVVPAPGDR
jgi:hypothetical protein